MFYGVFCVIVLIFFVGGLIWLFSDYMEPKLAVNAAFCIFNFIVAVACTIEFAKGFIGNLIRIITLQSYESPLPYAPLIVVAAVALLISYICGRNFVRLKREL